jgi:co-chaperonin GroES (HSP10)
MNVVKGKIIPLKDNVIVSDMNFDDEVSKVGIILRSQDGKSDGIKPRWGKVWAIGPTQQDVKVGEWVLIEHGRWTRGITVEEDGKELTVRMVEVKSIMLQADELPSEF